MRHRSLTVGHVARAGITRKTRWCTGTSGASLTSGMTIGSGRDDAAVDRPPSDRPVRGHPRADEHEPASAQLVWTHHEHHQQRSDQVSSPRGSSSAVSLWTCRFPMQRDDWMPRHQEPGRPSRVRGVRTARGPARRVWGRLGLSVLDQGSRRPLPVVGQTAGNVGCKAKSLYTTMWNERLLLCPDTCSDDTPFSECSCACPLCAKATSRSIRSTISSRAGTTPNPAMTSS